MAHSDSANSSVSLNLEKDLPGLPDRPAGTGLRQRIRKICIHLWIWEVLSLLLCISCVGTIIAILLRYDGELLPAWKFGLTINGVISVLAGIAKASMILPIAESISQLKWHWFWSGRSRPIMDFEYFDSASRGPWGCLILLCRPRQWSLVTVGAIITILALLMEPSLQFIPAYPLRSVQTTGASVARSTYYSDISIGATPDSTKSDNGISGNTSATIPTYSLGTASKNGFRNALFSYREDSATPSCPTGNCTWPNFSTLGVCSSCTNLTSELAWTKTPAMEEWMLPNGAYTYPSYYLDLSPAGWMDRSKYSIAYNRTTRQTILNFYYFENERITGIFTGLKPKVYECVLFFCVQEFAANMRAGQYSENVVSSWPDARDELPNFPNFEPGQALEPATFTMKNVTWSRDSSDSYSVDTLTFAMLREWIFDYVGSVSMSSDLPPQQTTEDTGQAIYEFQKNGNNTESFAAERLSKGLAHGLTVAVRSMSNSNMAAQGKAFQSRAFVKARWVFAILPIALVSTTCLFMAATLVITVRHEVPIWKSSALATLAHGLQDGSSACITADRLDVIEDKAGSHHMTVKDVGQQWRFAAMKT